LSIVQYSSTASISVLGWKGIQTPTHFLLNR
jgi:hypothetical protein